MRELTGPDAVALAEAQAARATPLVLLDVREPWEVAVAAIDLPGATMRWMPMREIPARLGELDARLNDARRLRLARAHHADS